MTLAPDDPRHGTYTGYRNHRCRCDDCKAANSAYARSRRITGGLDPGDPRHGTTNGYQNLGCRCDECRAANTESLLQWREKKAQERSS